MLCSVVVLNAQDIKFELEKTGMFKDEEKLSGIMGVSSDGKGGVIMVRWYNAYHGKKHGYLLEHYNNKMIKVKSQKFVLDKKREHLVGAVLDNNVVSLIEFAYDKKQKAYVCYAHVAHSEDFKFEKKELFKLNMKKESIPLVSFGDNVERFMNYSHATISFNNDKTAFAIGVNINTGKRKGEVHDVYVFNNKLDLIAKNSLKKDFKNTDYKIEDIAVAKDGSAAYILGKLEYKKTKKNRDPYYFDFTSLSNTETKSVTFDSDKYKIDYLKLAVKQEGVACLGFYYDKKWTPEGLAYFDIDPIAATIKEDKQLPFTEEFLNGHDKKSRKNFEPNSLLITQDNSLIFNAEERETNIIPSGGKSVKMEYIYKDIMAVKITDKGEVAWMKNIDKMQYTRGAANDFLSFTPMVNGNDMLYFMNGNLGKHDDGTPYVSCKALSRADLNVVRIDHQGNISAKKILDETQIKVPFRALDGVVIPNTGSIFFIGREYKNKQMIKVTL